MPTYMIGLFKLPITSCNKLERIMGRFWWGGGKNVHKIY